MTKILQTSKNLLFHYRVSQRLRASAVKLVILLLAAALAGCEKVPKLPRLGQGDAIVAFGDSLTFGTGANESESYPAVLAQLIGHPVVSAGVPGEVTAQGLERLPQVLDQHQPKLLILCLGGNDMLQKLDEAAIANNLREMIRMLKARGIAVVLIGVPKPGLLTGTAKFYGEVAREFDIPYEGDVIKSILYSADMKSDPIHPNAKGYRKMAEAVAGLLRKAGAV